MMELKLSLSLPNQDPIPGFKFSSKGLENKDLVDKEQWSRSAASLLKNKRGFHEAFGEINDKSAQTLPLLLWSCGQPNEDDRKGEHGRISCSINRVVHEEVNQVVGWPPIKSWRKKLLHQHQGGFAVESNRCRTARTESGGSSDSVYVKVKMEGVAITRKIDLRFFQSYQTLKSSLISMFAELEKRREDDDDDDDDDDDERYTLAYQDKDGDWLLAGDVPWQSFVNSVRRLGILRNSG